MYFHYAIFTKQIDGNRNTLITKFTQKLDVKCLLQVKQLKFITIISLMITNYD